MKSSKIHANKNIETYRIFLVLGVMILVIKGVYVLGSIHLLQNNEENRYIRKAKCESDFYAQIAKSKYGKYDSRYKKPLKKCIKEGYFLIP